MNRTTTILLSAILIVVLVIAALLLVNLATQAPSVSPDNMTATSAIEFATQHADEINAIEATVAAQMLNGEFSGNGT